MNALQLVNAVLTKLRQTKAINLSSPPPYIENVLRCLNDVQDELWSLHDWPYLKKIHEIVLEEGKDIYSLPNDFGRIIGRPYLFSPAFMLLDIFSDKDWQAETYGRKENGTPYICRIYSLSSENAHQIQLFYAPDASYNGESLFIEYLRSVNQLANDNDVSVFPDAILIQGAYCKMKINDGDADPLEYQIYERLISSYISKNVKQISDRFVKYRDF